jgi:hypothetical protein
VNQNVDWRVALAAVAALLLLVAAIYHWGGLSGQTAGRVSPQFQRLSPAEQRQALETAEQARRRRGAPPEPIGR